MNTYNSNINQFIIQNHENVFSRNTKKINRSYFNEDVTRCLNLGNRNYNVNRSRGYRRGSLKGKNSYGIICSAFISLLGVKRE